MATLKKTIAFVLVSNAPPSSFSFRLLINRKIQRKKTIPAIIIGKKPGPIAPPAAPGKVLAMANTPTDIARKKSVMPVLTLFNFSLLVSLTTADEWSGCPQAATCYLNPRAWACSL